MKPTFKDKLMQEAIDFFKIDSLLDDEDDSDGENDFLDFEDNDFSEEEFSENDLDFDSLDGSEGEFDDEEFNFDDENADFEEEEFKDEEEFEDETDPDKEGMIRAVKGAYMVYKRVTANNNYEELWVFNMGNVKYQTRIRTAILSGTDIDPTTLRSENNEQNATLWSKGNIQFLHIDGLPN